MLGKRFSAMPVVWSGFIDDSAVTQPASVHPKHNLQQGMVEAAVLRYD